ncbi:polyamine aminopropyltransferase [Candidatus Puniceispirillum sp.]|nr:polyamine aminopropyltransferase [Candidatus Puniceispirillum sp.]
MSEKFVETLHEGYAQSLSVDKVLYDNTSNLQHIQVFENRLFGRVLTLDGVVQTTQGDEFIYHEMLAHVPILAHGKARRVLIIGGGVGGMAREVLRHQSVETVTMVEIDAGVIAFSKTYLPSLSDGAFDDKRLNLVIADGADFMMESVDEFDVIIIDSTDPIGPGEVLFTDHFYGHAKNRLAVDGVLVTQNGVPFMQPEELQGTMHAFQKLFVDWGCYIACIPTYAGGPMAFGWGALSAAPRNVSVDLLRERLVAARLDLAYYTPDVHKAAFSLPGYIEKLLP